MKKTIYVYRHSHAHQYDDDTRIRFYTLTYATLQGRGACIHEVDAETTREAKKLAAREHEQRCGNRVTS